METRLDLSEGFLLSLREGEGAGMRNANVLFTLISIDSFSLQVSDPTSAFPDPAHARNG